MHDSAIEYAEKFFATYTNKRENLTIVDIGSQDLNGSLKSIIPKNNQYIGCDFKKAKNVDIVLTDPYTLPLENESTDIILSSSCFEHSEFFWLLFNEILRVLKPNGLLYINAPSNGSYHRYPIDCWRFYPDSGIALQNWGRKSGYPCALLESFIGVQKKDIWNDFVAVFVKNENSAPQYKDRIQDKLKFFTNGRLYNSENIINFSALSQDQFIKKRLKAIINSTKIISK